MKVRRLICILMTLLLCLSMAACGAESQATDEYYSNEMESPREENGLVSDTTSGTADAPVDSRKWIITVNMDAETEDLDALLTQLEEQIAGLNGYVEDQNIYNGSTYSSYRYRNASLTIRIPADRVDAFTRQLGDISNVVSTNLSREDITLRYVDTESRMKALQTEEARLLELMEMAETMSDLLEIEARLTDVRYELDSVTSQLRTYDNLVDYATIYLSISEVREYTPVEEPTLWERIRDGFVGSVESLGNIIVELFVFVLVASPYLVVIGGIVALIVFLAKRDAKKRRAAQTPPDSPREPKAE